MRRVPLNDLVRQNRLVQEELGAAARRVIERGWYVLGSECTDFETAFADYCAVSHCIGVANGTDAIELALRALGVAGGDGVATVANAGAGATHCQCNSPRFARMRRCRRRSRWRANC